MDTSPHKRHRVLASCSVCRKRKSKCDRQRPICGSCRKKSIAHLCSYDDEPSHAQTQVFPPVPPHFPPGSVMMGVPGQQAPFPPPPPPQVAYQVIPIYSQSPWPPQNAPTQSYFEYYQQQGGPPNSQPFDGHSAPQNPPQNPNVPQNPRQNSIGGPQNPHPNSNRLQNPPMNPVQLQSATPGTPGNLTGAFYHAPLRDAPDLAFESSSSSTSQFGSQHSHNVPQSTGSADSRPRERSLDQKLPPQQVYVKKSPVAHTNMEAYGIPEPVVPPESSSNISTPAVNGPMKTNSIDAVSPSSSHTSNTFSSAHKKQTFQQPDPSYVSVTIGHNVLRIATNDTMDAFSTASNTLLVSHPCWQQQGPLSYVGLTKKDPFTKLVRNFTVELFKSDQFSQFRGSKEKRAQSESKEATDVSSDEEMEEVVLNEDSLVTTKINVDREQVGTGNFGVDHNLASIIPKLNSLQAIKGSKREYYKFVAQSVLPLLPTQREINEAINRFFQFVYPFIPIIHEKSFLNGLKTVFRNQFPGESDGYYTVLRIRNESQLILVGQLLLIIRLGYMTLIPNNETDFDYTEVQKTLIRSITKFKSFHYIGVINLCIPEEKVQVMSSFEYVQGLSLLYFYRSVAPNDCHGLSGSDSQLLFGAIVTHAMSIGLNRDPMEYDAINYIPKDTAYVNTWRRLWKFIVQTDAYSSIMCGTPLKITNLNSCDVKSPTHKPFSDEYDKFCAKIDNVCRCYRNVVNKVTNLHEKLRVIDLLSETSKLEKIFLEIFGQDFFRDYVSMPAPKCPSTYDQYTRGNNEEQIMKVQLFMLFINMRANISCLYYLVVIHYERQVDLNKDAEIGAGIELFKIFTRSIVQLVYIMSYVLDNSSELFGPAYDYILTAKVERSMIKAHIFMSSFFIRLINYKRTLAIQRLTVESNDLESRFEERSDAVDQLFTIVLLEAELFVGHFRTLGETYINSYKLYVMAFFVLKQCMENPELLLTGFTNKKHSFFHDGTNLLQFLTNDELQNLCKLCEEFRVAKLDSIDRRKSHQEAHNRKRAEVKNEVDDVLSDDFDFNAIVANRATYANEDTVNTYGLLKEEHKKGELQNEVFDEKSMIGNDELLKLFELYGYLEASS